MLWPYALKYASERLNKIDMAKDGTTREQRFSGGDSNTINVKDYHSFGCPVYVLDSNLQSVPATLPKWEPRCRVGVYLGHSPQHAGNVALVLNLTTGHVSPQYHIVFDDHFSTVPSIRTGIEPPNWKTLFDNHRESSLPSDFKLATEWTQDFNQGNLPSFDTSSSDNDENNDSNDSLDSTDSTVNHSNVTQNEGASLDIDSDLNSSNEGDFLMPEIRNLEQNGLRRSTRIRNAPDRWQFYTKIPIIKSIFSFNLYPLEHSTFPSSSSYFQRSINHLIHVNTLLDNTINNLTSFSFMSQTDNETYTYGEMLKQDDRSDFIQAMLVEVNDHFSRETVEKVPKIIGIIDLWLECLITWQVQLDLTFNLQFINVLDFVMIPNYPMNKHASIFVNIFELLLLKV